MPRRWLIACAFCVLASPVSAQARYTFAWDAGTDADGYQVQIGSAPGTTSQELSVGQTLTAAVDLPAGTFYVRVRAYNLTGFSATTSNEVRVDVAGPPPPPPPPPPPTCDPPVVTTWPTQKKNASQLQYTSTWTVTSVTINGHGQTVSSATFTGSGCTITVPKQ